MKQKATRKFLKENYHIINIGNGRLQTLLTFESPSYYCTRVEGWACDGYVFGDYVLVSGYDCPGKLISYEVTKKYEEKAREIYEKYRYGNSKYWTLNRTRNILHKMINEFIEEVK